MDLRVDFSEADGSLLTISEGRLPKGRVGDSVTLYDDDIECDCRIVGKLTRSKGAVFLVMVPTKEQRESI